MIKLSIGDFEFGLGIFRIGDWGFKREDWGKRNMGKTPIPKGWVKKKTGKLSTFCG